MNFYIGVTDKNWYEYQKAHAFDEVNFWQPRDTRDFTAIKPGELFLFKLHYPENYVVGGGILLRQTVLPLSLTWEVFGNKNGMDTAVQFESSIYRLRRTNRREDADPKVGSIILSQPFFLEKQDWIPMDGIWDKNIVQGKIYDALTEPGREILEKIKAKTAAVTTELPLAAEERARFGSEQVVKPRLGQAGFRVEVIEVYHRRCAVTGEKTLPVLDAAHIKPYTEQGPHDTRNGILLRKDLHTLFDRGFITVTGDYFIEVSKKIKENYGNGKEYYAFHGKQLSNMPDAPIDKPAKDFLQWHNENIYVG